LVELADELLQRRAPREIAVQPSLPSISVQFSSPARAGDPWRVKMVDDRGVVR
jgi:hypothetical protein